MVLTLYAKPGCTLCAVVRLVVAKVAREYAVRVVEVDVGRTEVPAEIAANVPVLDVAGSARFQHFVTEEALVRVLRELGARRRHDGALGSATAVPRAHLEGASDPGGAIPREGASSQEGAIPQ